jgi:aminomethyltransferase
VICLTQIDADHATPGTQVMIGALDGAQKHLAAKTAPLCVFDPDRQRIQGHYG